MRYTLREMTLIWEVFGGQDFPKSASSSNPRLLKALEIELSPNHSNFTFFFVFSNKPKFNSTRTVTFSKGSDNLDKVKIRTSSENLQSPYHSASKPCGGGRRFQNHSGGCNRQQDVKLELQMNKV